MTEEGTATETAVETEAVVETEAATAAEEATPEGQLAKMTADRDKWKGNSRKNEAEKKANAAKAKQFDELKASQMTEQEKAVETAVEAAKVAARAETRREFGDKLVAVSVRAAATLRGIDADALLEAIDLSRFLDDDSEPDTASIDAWLDKVAPKAGGHGDIGQGRGGTGGETGMDPLTSAVTRKLGITI